MLGLFIYFFCLIIALIWLMKIILKQKIIIEDLNNLNDGLCKENLELMDKLIDKL